MAIRLGISTYSYWHFRGDRTPIETVIDQAARLDVSGVDILHQQMESEDPAYLQKLKRHAFRSGVDLINLSIHQNFVSPDAAVRYAELADIFVIAPASADLLAHITHGFAGDMLTSALVANIHKPVLVAPAMNTDMWANPAVQENRRTMERRGYIFIEPGVGRLAEGVVGAGRLAEPPEIVAIVRQTLLTKRDLEGVRVLVTAGPTREPIDPVRFLSNRSSGKMGYAIADAAASRGALVTLVTGPTALPIPAGVAETVRAETASQMQEAVLSRSAPQDVIVQSAAIADFRPAQVAPQKIKKSHGVRVIELAHTTDFSIILGEQKHPGQILVGFAAETEKMEEHALAKLRSKNLDLLIANDITRPGAGFEVDTNIVTFYRPDAESVSLPQQSKRAVADAICDQIVGLRRE